MHRQLLNGCDVEVAEFPTSPHALGPNRRQAIIGFGCVAATTALPTPGSAAALGIWGTIVAGVASAWLFEWLKSLRLVPGLAGDSVSSHHQERTGELRNQGYQVYPRYRGAYSGGGFELSEARRGDDFLALGTSQHATHHGGRSTCSIRFDTADATNLGLVARALSNRGYSAGDIEESILPLHPSAANRFEGSRRYSPTYLTPSGGTIAWSTDVNASQPNILTTVRSRAIRRQFDIAMVDRQWRVRSQQV